jgi:transposase
MGVEEREPDIHGPCRERVAALEAIIAEQQKLFVEQQRQFQEQIVVLQTRMVDLEKKNTELKRLQAELEIQLARARKDSSTSSKPPSSDIVKPPKEPPQEGEGERKKGAQPGHPKHERPPFSPDQIDEVHPYTLEECPDCGDDLEPSDAAPRVIQQVEIVERPIVIEEHRGEAYWCKRCRKIHYAPLPAEVERAGLTGPALTAIVGYMKGACHASFSTIRKFLRDIVGLKISRGQLAKIVGKVSDALAGPYEELLRSLPSEATVNVDETGHKENGERFWTWCFRANLYVLFRIDKSRGSDVLIDVLGKEFDGVIGCDYFSAYRKYMKDFNVAVQFCMAHLIRDVKFLITLPDEPTKAYGVRLLEEIREMFGVIHRREQMQETAFLEALEARRQKILTVGLDRVPGSREAQNMANRFHKHGEAYFRFITTPGMDPTNNVAEQAIRFVVIDRLVTQGTRSEKGRRWCQRIWTVLATCARQGRSAFEFLLEAVQSHFAGTAFPSLLAPGLAASRAPP